LCNISLVIFYPFRAFGISVKEGLYQRLQATGATIEQDLFQESFWILKTLIGGLSAQGGQACLAQARQDRPGIGELDLTKLLCVKT